ncbi:MAG: hypothetical protein LBU32_30365 [Clostridiales bacterium]|jgi:hypothetical protein|nr:hypothetical protein [Clostridiales bacterium]
MPSAYGGGYISAAIGEGFAPNGLGARTDEPDMRILSVRLAMRIQTELHYPLSSWIMQLQNQRETISACLREGRLLAASG